MCWLFKISWLQIYRLIAPIRRQFVWVLFKNAYCPGEEAALGIIVVSLTYTAYLWATLIAFCTNKEMAMVRTHILLSKELRLY